MMVVLVIALIALLLALLVWFVSAPLRKPARLERLPTGRRGAGGGTRGEYAEIRDTELDYRTASCPRRTSARLDRQLRAEAVEILRSLDELR